MKGHVSSWTALVHRLSGIALALFLPLHFYALGQALQGAGALEGFLEWTRHPLLKASEWCIVVALGAHLACGLRVLALEFLPWRDWQKSLAAAAAGITAAIGLALALAL